MCMCSIEMAVTSDPLQRFGLKGMGQNVLKLLNLN